MSDDISNEVDQLFTNNTVDQVVIKCAEQKRQIQTTQEELRSLIGSRYRELLHACDQIVGMDTICEAFKQRPSEQSRPQNAAASQASVERETSDVPMDTLRAQDAMLARDLARRVHSIYVLTSNGLLHEAAVRYRGAAKALTDVEGTINDYLFGSVRRSAAAVPARINSGIAEMLIDLVRSGNIATQAMLDRYADANAALEQLCECSASTAVSKLIALHKDAIGRLAARGTGTSDKSLIAPAIRDVVGLLCNGSFYLHNCRTAVSGQQLSKLSANDLLQLDPNDPAYIQTMSMQLLGLGALHAAPTGGSAAVSAADGWALSPSSVPPAADADMTLSAELQRAAEDAVEGLVSQLNDVSALMAAEQDWSAKLEVLQERVGNAAHDNAAFADRCETLVSARVLAIVGEQLTAAASEGGAAAAAIVTSDAETPAKPSSSSALAGGAPTIDVAQLIRDRLRRPAEGAILGDKIKSELGAIGGEKSATANSNEASSSIATLKDTLVVALVAANEALDRIAKQQGSRAALATNKLHEALIKGFRGLSGAISTEAAKARAKNASDALFGLSKLVDTVQTAVRSLRKRIGTNAHFAQLAAELAELSVACHEPWIREVASKLEVDISAGLDRQQWAMPSKSYLSTYANNWTEVTVDTASVAVPRSASVPLYRSLLQLQRRIRQREPHSISRRLTTVLNEAVTVAVCNAYSSLLGKCAAATGEVPDEAFLQIYFDLRFLRSAYPTAATSNAARQLLRCCRDVEARVDVVNWNVSAPVVESHATEAVGLAALALIPAGDAVVTGGSSPTSAAGPSSREAGFFRVRAPAEIPRVAALPLATPSATSMGTLVDQQGATPIANKAAANASAHANGNSSAANGAWGTTTMPSLKGLRSAFSWK